MKYELVFSTDFTQTPLYEKLVAFIGDCNALIPKVHCQGRKLFAGRIRWELGCMTQLLLHAAATERATKRRYFISLTQQHFQVACGLLKCCCDLKFLPAHHYETLNLEIFDSLQLVRANQ
ncbi:MAG: hypothetical protein LBB41_05210 [Prevotellaceae bacterium]|jgi:hypothetical protein|nr:hypothetical protein [Prevotellaceae bacterium]